MHFDYIAVGGGFVCAVSPRVWVQVNEAEDEGVQEKCDASRGTSNHKALKRGAWIFPGWLSPKHNKNIRDVVHPGPVHEFGFFIGRRHEQ